MLTSEREKEIRGLNTSTLKCFDYSPDDLCQEVFDIKELLAEIDRLRADYRNSLSDTVDVIKECDQLREKLAVYENKLHWNSISLEILERERDHLRDQLLSIVGNRDKLVNRKYFCLFCEGTGSRRDPVLLRPEECQHCGGTGK